VGAVFDGGGYFAVAGCVGLIGAIPFGALIVALGVTISRYRGRPGTKENERLYGLQACSIIVGLLVELVGEPWLLGPGSPIHLVFWMCVGALMCATNSPQRAR
jgi:hypothetical protein